MSIRVTCSGCGTRLKVSDDAAGSSVKCPKCAGGIVVPAPADEVPPEPLELPADEDPRPRRRTRPQKTSAVPVWVWVLLGVGAVGAVVVCAGLLWIGKSGADLFSGKKKGDMNMKEFKLQNPTGVVTVRARVSLSNYWNYQYLSSGETHHGLNLSDPTYKIHAWVSKNSAEGNRIYNLCKDGSEHWMTLKVHRVGPDGTATPSGHEGTAVLEILDDK